MLEHSSKYFALAVMSMLVTATLMTSHPAYSATTTGIMIPLYTYPGSTWDQVIAAKNAHPSVPIVAIINPNNGPGSAKDSNYASGIQELQSAGVVVIGYVFTQYGSRSSGAITADIDSYKAWYPQINGIFYDEMTNTPGDETYYRNLSNYAKSVGFSFTVGNPGTDTATSYVGTMDNIIIYETGGLPSLSILGGWHTGYDKSNFSLLAYGVGTLNEVFVDSASNYVSYMYITNDSLSNPWDSVTPYFMDLAAALDDGTTPPPNPTPTQPLTVQSADLAGASVSGLWTEISTGGAVVNSGYTPLTYTATSNTQYTVCVSNYQNYVFDHWSDGSTNNCKTVTTTEDTNLKAYYKSPVTLRVRSVGMNGSVINGLWTEISTGNNLVKSGYTTLSYTANAGTLYTVCVSNYQNYVFDHWSDGNTNSCKTVTPTKTTTLTAYYMR